MKTSRRALSLSAARSMTTKNQKSTESQAKRGYISTEKTRRSITIKNCCMTCRGAHM
nr:MAG TPA: hypothetical protein [Caudoviricetes sp.]